MGVFNPRLWSNVDNQLHPQSEAGATNASFEQKLGSGGCTESSNKSIPTRKQMHDAVVEWVRMEESIAGSNNKVNKFNAATIVYDIRNDQYY